jgi:hypothetical protein
MKPRRTPSLTIRKGDEHTQLQINDNLTLCQATMTPKIDDAKNTAVKCHDRLDCHIKDDHKEVNDRLSTMDAKEIGKVTILWNDRNKVIVAFGALLVAIITNVAVAWFKNSRPISKQDLQDAVKSAIVEISKGGAIK